MKKTLSLAALAAVWMTLSLPAQATVDAEQEQELVIETSQRICQDDDAICEMRMERAKQTERETREERQTMLDQWEWK